MFEQSLQTEEWKDQQAIEGRSLGEIESRRLAAIIVAVNAMLSLIVSVAANRHQVPVVQTGIALFVSWYLFRLRPRAENLVLGLALLGAIIGTIAFFLKFAFLPALLQSLATWGIAGSLLLLLIGEPSVLRRAVAVALFLVVGCGVYAVALVGAIAQRFLS